MTLIEQIQQHNPELIRFRSLLDEACAKDAKSNSQPEDRIVFPLLVAARDIMEEILFAISNGHGLLLCAMSGLCTNVLLSRIIFISTLKRRTITLRCSTFSGPRSYRTYQVQP
jgi:hypothetical protein